jgi:hypothetical protein
MRDREGVELGIKLQTEMDSSDALGAQVFEVLEKRIRGRNE